jgi:hypothetical protein
VFRYHADDPEVRKPAVGNFLIAVKVEHAWQRALPSWSPENESDAFYDF